MQSSLPTLAPGNLPRKRLFRLAQLIGQLPVTEQEAIANRLRGKGPKRARPGVAGIIPVSGPTWWRWVKSGKAPKAIRLGDGVTAWEEEAILAFIEVLAAADSKAVASAGHGPATKALPSAPQVDQAVRHEDVCAISTAALLAELERRTAPTQAPPATRPKQKSRPTAKPVVPVVAAAE